VNHKKQRLAGVWSKLIIIIYLTTTASNEFFIEKQKASQLVKKKTSGIYHPYTGRLIMFSMITNIYNKKTKGPTIMELFTATEN